MSNDDDDDKIGKFEKTIIDGELTEVSKEILAGLTAREAKALRIRFGIDLKSDHTLEEVGKQFDVMRERIRQVEKKAMEKLKASKEKKIVPKCSFCGKPAKDVKKMIASELNHVHICDECIKSCMGLIDE